MEQPSGPTTEDHRLAVKLYNKGNELSNLGQWSQAIETYSMLIKLDESNPQFYEARAHCYVSLENLKDAEIDYSSALHCDPGCYRLYFKRGGIRRQLQKFQEAAIDFQSALICKPNDELAYESYLQTSLLSVQADQRYDLGIPPYTTDMTAQASAYKNKGNELVRTKDWGKAALCYTQAAMCNPKDHLIFCNRALCHLKLEQYKHAELDCSIAIGLNDKFAKAYYRRALALKGQGNINEAYNDILNCLEIEPNSSVAQDEAACLLQAQKSQTGKSQNIQELPENMCDYLYFALGRDFYAHKYYENAVECFTRSITNEGGCSASHFLRGVCYKALNRCSEAEKDYTKAIDLGEKSTDVFRHRASCRVHLGMLMEAMEDFRAVLAKDNQDPYIKRQVRILESLTGYSGGPFNVDYPCSDLLNEYFERVKLDLVPSLKSKAPLVEIPIFDVKGVCEVETVGLMLRTYCSREPDIIQRSYSNMPLNKPEVTQEDKGTISRLVELPPQPQNMAEFIHVWDKLKGLENMKACYLMSINTKNLPTLFKEMLTSHLLSEIVNTLVNHCERTWDVVLFFLGLCNVKRIRTLSLLMSDEDKLHVKTFFSGSVEEKLCSTEEFELVSSVFCFL